MPDKKRDKHIMCFPPLMDEKTRILILGTVPGEQSLYRGTYYANKRNHFWDFMYRILEPKMVDDELESLTTDVKNYQLILDNAVGLWDIIAECYRSGSNDSKIKNPTYNNLTSVLSSKIEVVICNGKNVYKHLKASGNIDRLSIPIVTLGSTSTLNPNNTFTTLVEWKKVFEKWLC